MDGITIQHFSKICRFCLGQSSDELKIISDIPSTNIFKAITEVEDTGILPQKICLSCENIFQTFFLFIEKSKQNINWLLTVYEQAHQVNKFDSSDNEEYDDSLNFNEDQIVKEEECKYKSSENNRIKSAAFKCEMCKKRFVTEKLLVEHTKVLCLCVEPELDSRKSGKRSKKANLKPRNITCTNCKLTFKSRKDLRIHCKDGLECQPIEYKCPECNKSFKFQYRLNNHMRSHTKEAPFQCTECEKTFRFQQNLKRHILIHKGVKKYKCEDCGKAFSRAHVLNEHRNIHTGHNPYICDYCGKGFKRYTNHFIHIYRHKLLNGEVDQTEDKKLYLQLQCNICNKIFASRGGLENHLTLHQEEPREKKFLCTDCGKGFYTNAQLESHMRIHTGDRPYECNQCGKKFKQKSTYSNHQLVHSGEKPYQCHICDRFFTQSGHLRVHMRVHSGEKPFECNFCGKKFALRTNLKVHTRTHTGEKPYICSVCNKGYYDSTNLKKHMKSHGIGVPSHGHVESKLQAENAVS